MSIRFPIPGDDMKAAGNRITEENFVPIRRRIEIMIEEFQLNVEMWRVKKFYEISETASQESVTALQLWVNTALSDSVRDTLLQGEESPLSEKHTLVLSAEIYEQLESLRKLYGLEDSNETVKTLLAYYKKETVRQAE